MNLCLLYMKTGKNDFLVKDKNLRSNSNF
jgi:hypothetical protein